MTTVAAIAAKALDKVALKITDAVHAAVLERVYQDSYSVTLGAYERTWPRQDGRVVFSGEAPKADMFPAYVVGRNDQLALLEGFTGVIENDTIRIGVTEYTVVAVQDIAGAGTVYNVVLR